MFLKYIALNVLYDNSKVIYRNTITFIFSFNIPDGPVCPLCRQEIDFDNSTDLLEHRRQCYEEHEDLVKALPAAKDISCPLCNGPLRQWPANTKHSIKFQCQAGDPPCPATYNKENTLIRETGDNRFSCFLCSYDLCDFCVERRVEGIRNRLNYNRNTRVNANRNREDQPHTIVILQGNASQSVSVTIPDSEDSESDGATTSNAIQNHTAPPPSYEEVVKANATALDGKNEDGDQWV